MTTSTGLSRLASSCVMAIAALALPAAAAFAQDQGQVPAQARSSIEKATGMWVEGPGFDINYGGTYDRCAERCLATSSCVMIEYYRPEKKCNMYDAVRPLKSGGASIVGTKKAAKS